MANHIFILATVMLLAGIFGGLVNYYLYGDNDPEATSLPRCLVVGVGASFLVPVILDLVSSELILETQGDPSRLLIFTGFCLISAIASRFFITNVSDRILSEARNAKERSETVQHDLRIIKNELLPLIDTETEQDLESSRLSPLSLMKPWMLPLLKCCGCWPPDVIFSAPWRVCAVKPIPMKRPFCKPLMCWRHVA